MNYIEIAIALGALVVAMRTLRVLTRVVEFNAELMKVLIEKSAHPALTKDVEDERIRYLMEALRREQMRSGDDTQ